MGLCPTVDDAVRAFATDGRAGHVSRPPSPHCSQLSIIARL